MKRKLPEEAGIFGVLAVVFLAFCVLSTSFRTWDNTKILLVNGAVVGFLALGQTFVLLTGGIDLSTGANIAMTGVIAAMLTQTGMPWVLSAVLAVAVGTLLGIINGALIHYLRIPPFIVTFATQGVALAIPLILTKATSKVVKTPGFSWIGSGSFLGVDIPIWLLIIAAVTGAFFLKMTRQGVHVYAMGGNPAAARLSGVNIPRTTMLVYGVSGFCAGMGGIISTSQLGAGFPQTGTHNELFYSIAAAVVGGVSLFGGVGTVLGAMIGSVLIATVNNGMNVLNIQSYWQSLVIGLIILAGVSFDTYRRTHATRAKAPKAKVAAPTAQATS